MAKYLKFALADSGTLVYRATGKAYRGVFTIRTSGKTTTVYGADGRKIGTIGKPTAKEKAKIDQLDKRNYKARTKPNQAKIEKKAKLDWKFVQRQATYQNYVIAQESTRLIPRRSWKAYQISYTEQSKMNYAKALSEAVKSGKLNNKKADILFKQYSRIADQLKGAKDREKDSKLAKMWHSLNKDFDEIGFKYEVEVSDDVKENLTDKEYEAIILGEYE